MRFQTFIQQYCNSVATSLAENLFGHDLLPLKVNTVPLPFSDKDNGNNNNNNNNNTFVSKDMKDEYFEQDVKLTPLESHYYDGFIAEKKALKRAVGLLDNMHCLGTHKVCES